MKIRYSLLITHCLLLIVLLLGCSSVQPTPPQDTSGKSTGDNEEQKKEEDLGDTYIQMGAMFFVDGKFDIAMEQFRKALREYVKRYGKESPKVATAYFNIGTVYLAKGGIVEAKVYYGNVKGICENSDDKICVEIMKNIERNLWIAEQRRML